MSGKLRDRKREDYLRATGRGLTVRGREVERALQRVRSFSARGMTFVQMEEQIGVHRRTLSEMAQGREFLYRVNYEALMRMQFEEPRPHAWVDATGTRRRLAAMWAAGFPLPWLVEQLDFPTRSYAQCLIRGYKGAQGVRGSVTYQRSRQVAALYDKLDGVDPLEVGVVQRAATYARTCAAKKGCAPRECWDVDTIDDPDTIPDWTGRCGTAFGWLVHEREGIPACVPCLNYRVDFILDGTRLQKLRLRKGLSQTQIAQAAGITADTYRTWEVRGSQPRTLAALDRVLAILDVTYEEVCREE